MSLQQTVGLCGVLRVCSSAHSAYPCEIETRTRHNCKHVKDAAGPSPNDVLRKQWALRPQARKGYTLNAFIVVATLVARLVARRPQGC